MHMLGFLLRSGTARRLAAVCAAAIGILAFQAAAADDTAACTGSDAATGIPACTRLIEHGDATAIANGYANRGRFYVERNELDLALADLNEALRLNPANANVQHNRGYC